MTAPRAISFDDPVLDGRWQEHDTARVSPVKQTARVAVCHRDTLFVDAMQAVLEGESVAVTQATSLEALFDVAHIVDACLIDMRLDDAEPVLRALSERFEGLRLVGITETADDRHARAATAAGAHACIAPDDGLDRLLAVLRAADHGSEALRRPGRGRRRSHATRNPRRLTAREREVLDGLMEGDNTKQLALRLGVSQATARTHVQSVLTKIGAHTRLEAVALVQSRALVSLLQDDDECGGGV